MSADPPQDPPAGGEPDPVPPPEAEARPDSAAPGDPPSAAAEDAAPAAPVGPGADGQDAVPPEDPGGGGVAVVLALAALLAALLGGRAALLSDTAGDAYDKSMRTHVKQAAAAVEDIRFVYGDEASVAFLEVTARARADALRRQAESADPETATALEAEAQVQWAVAEALSSSSEITSSHRYRDAEGRLDIAARLGDVRAQSPDLVDLAPDAFEAEGRTAARRASVATAATVPAALAFAFGALTQGWPRRRRLLLRLAFLFLLVGAGMGALSAVV